MNYKTFVNRFSAVFVVALVFLGGCKKQDETLAPAPATSPAPTKPAIVSAVHNSFDEVTAKLDKGGNFYLYLSTEQVLTNLSAYLSAGSNFVAGLPNVQGQDREKVDKVFSVLDVAIKQSGVSEISGLGMSSIAREPKLFYNKVVLHHYPGQNAGMVWTLFGKTSHPLAVMDMLPETTALASSLDFDLPLLWTNILDDAQMLNVPEVSAALDSAPGKFKEVTGLDLDAVFASLGGEYGVIVTLDTNKMITLPLGAKTLEIPTPGLCLVFKVKSNIIFDRVDEILKGNPLLTKVDEEGLKMRTMNILLPLPVALRPSLARVGKYLLLASSDDMIKEIVEVKSGKKKGFKSTDEFKRLSQGVPNEGNTFSLAAGVFTSSMSRMQGKSMADQNLNPEAFDNLTKLLQQSTNSFSVGANGSDGWVASGNGASESMAALILPAVATAGILAAVAIPNFVKARTTSQENACINNLRLIDAAKQQWALENKKQNTDTPKTEDIQPYLGRGAKGEMPTCPAGGTYTYGAVGEKPTCSIAGHVLP
jgi:hypothetical protein